MEAKHTATPWAITGQPQKVTDTCGYTVTDANGEFVAEFETYTQAIAAVDACNAHDELVKALTDAERIISTALRERQFTVYGEAQLQNKFNADALIGEIRATLAKAGAA